MVARINFMAIKWNSNRKFVHISLIEICVFFHFLSFHYFYGIGVRVHINRSGDNNTSNKASSSSTDHANTSSDDSNAPASASGNTTTNSSDGTVKFVEAPLPKVNAWKVSYTHISPILFVHVFVIGNFIVLDSCLSKLYPFTQYFMEVFVVWHGIQTQLGRTILYCSYY